MGKARKTKPPARPSFERRVELRMSEAEKTAFREAAARQGITLSQWLRLAAWQAIHDHGGKVKLIELEG
jgi:uncharacterized protein (DUF1778 family)